jgi:hypothetical protein
MVVLALLAGLWAALQRLGWSLPTLQPGLAGIHGPLMIGGVLGTLICLERSVALAASESARRHWSMVVPLCSGLGGLLLILTGYSIPARVLIVGGSLGLVTIFALIVRRHLATYTVVMSAGALAWLAGNLLWAAGQPVYLALHWWIAFLVLTIVGERLELARITRPSTRTQQLFLLATGIFLSGVMLTLFDLNSGVRLAGIGEVTLALWLLRYDIARHTVRRAGLSRFIAVCLLMGYVWLVVGGIMGIVVSAVYAGYQYDALLHALLLGFVISMIFGHAPIILPALTGRPVVFHRVFYSYLILLHISLVARELGDLTATPSLRMWGGLFSVVAILLFLAVLLAVNAKGGAKNTSSPNTVKSR